MGRTRGCIWLAAGMIVALLAGVVAFVTLSRTATARPIASGQSAEGPAVKVVIASQAVPVGTLLTPDDRQDDAGDRRPPVYLGEIEQAVGKMTASDLVQGEAVVASRLMDPDVVSNDGRLALVVNDDQVLMAFPPDDLMSKIGLLTAGDHVDLLVSVDVPTSTAGGSEAERTTVDLLSNVTIAGIVAPLGKEGPVEPQALLLTVDPQDALILKYAKDKDGVVDLVLRARRRAAVRDRTRR